MVARGEVALVIAVLGQQTGAISDELFAACIVVTLLTTLAAPLLLRAVLQARTVEPLESARTRLVAQMERLEA
jgi:Kef-type K+ transport system membrane component KefB